MAKAVWNDIYSVEIKEIDEQHKSLIDFLNQGYASASADPNNIQLFLNYFENLMSHAELHFGTEEKYFKQFNFSGSQEHIVEHNKIKEKIFNLQSKYQQTHNIDVIFDTLQMIDDWIFEHIMQYDKKYVALFKEHGLK